MLYNVSKLNVGGIKMIVSELSEGLREIFIKWEQTFRGAVDICEFTSEQELIDFTIELCKNNINNNIDSDLYSEFLDMLNNL